MYKYIVVVQARWNVDIGMDSSVVEHTTSDAGVPGSISGPSISFHLCFYIFFIPPILMISDCYLMHEPVRHSL